MTTTTITRNGGEEVGIVPAVDHNDPGSLDEVEGAPKEPVRAFASVPSASPAYTSTLDAMRSPAMRASVLAQAKKELDGWRRRYRHYQELAAAVEQVERASESIAA